jgi:uncharacterized protein involved in outer membrane biogenesis
MTGRRRLGVIAAVLALVILVPVVAASVFLASLDPAAVKARVIAEVQRATGRALSVGALRLRLLPDLTIEADQVALANPAGFSRPAMITATHLRGRVALLPLLGHQVVVRDLALSGVDLKLEAPAGLAPNWVFAPTPRPALPPARAASPATRLRLDKLTLLGITADGTVAWQTPASSGSVVVQSLGLREVNASSTIFLSLSATLSGEAVRLTGQFGGQNHLWDTQDRSDWPVALKLAAAAGSIDVGGTISRPRALVGYNLAIRARGPDLGRLFSAWPALAAPRLRDLVLDTHVIDRSDGVDIPRLSLTAGQSDLSANVSGLHLSELAIVAPNIDGTNGTQVNHVRAAGDYAGQTLALDATLGPVGRLFGRGQIAARSPITLDAMATAAGATVRVNGRVAPSGDWAGTDASVTATIPDLGALSPLAGRTLPGLRDVSLTGAVRSAHGVLSLVGAHLTLPQAELRADGTASLGGRPRYQGQMRMTRVDLDGLGSLLATARAVPSPAPGGFHPPDTAAPAAAVPVTAAPAAMWIIPDRALPFDRLGDFDADVSITADTLLWHGATVTAAAAHLRLDHARLAIDPARGQLGGATVAGSLLVDASHQPATIALALNAPGLDAAAIAAVAGQAGEASGRLDLDAALTGAGATAHQIAGSLDGHLGIALTGGALANRLLLRALALVTPVSQLGLALPSGGSSDIACLATGFDLLQGIAVPRAFLLDSSRLRLAAAGAIDLRDETLALRLRPYIRLGGTGLVLPSRADGSWRAPRLTLEAASGAASAAALANGLVLHDAQLGALLAGLAQPADALLGLADSGDCAPALAAAHNVGSLVSAAATPPASAKPKSRRDRAIDILKKLFR